MKQVLEERGGDAAVVWLDLEKKVMRELWTACVWLAAFQRGSENLSISFHGAEAARRCHPDTL